MAQVIRNIVKGIGVVIAALAIVATLIVGVPNVVMIAGNAGNIKTEQDLVETETTYDCIVVLGASVLPDGSPSGILQDRLDTGIALYYAGVAPKLIMSGDDLGDTSYDEVTNMKAYVVSQGVPSEDVFCDHAGLCTYDSAYRLKNVFEARNAVVVTQTYHLYRALYDCNSMKVETVGVASDLHSYANQSYYDMREIGARISDFYKVLRKQTSTYLSEPVDLSQSGDVTSW